MIDGYRFVHAADLHLDTPFAGLGQIAPHLQTRLSDASLEAWDNLVELTIHQNAAFLLLAGDLYDGAQRGVRAQLRLHSGLERLSGKGIQTFIVHGNHDPVEGWSAINDIRNWPPGVTIFAARTVDAVPVRQGETTLAMVHGMSYPERYVTENLALRYQRGTEPVLHIGLLHCNVGSNSNHANYSPCSIDNLKHAGMDYWALGHVHARKILSHYPDWIVYPGNLQGRSHKPSETGPKGALVIEVKGATIQPPRFIPLDRVRFELGNFDISGVTDLPTLRKELSQWGQSKLAEHGDRLLLLRAVLLGCGEVQRTLARSGVPGELLQYLREEQQNNESRLWWDTIEDHTRSPLDRAALRLRDDFYGMLVQQAEKLLLDAESTDSFVTRSMDEIASLLDKERLKEFMTADTEPSESSAALLEEALAMALDRFYQELAT
ncbi:MAG: DNA repair exonuclease [Cyanobacteria bacterium NC_groundwater_1444_Ag_S-0.65um_54_12]|nr:DNA repair exonuclease [Cyanobacteria bacterium NC_groundwater_1444_Ag_S-0.65um_54_12]